MQDFSGVASYFQQVLRQKLSDAEYETVLSNALESNMLIDTKMFLMANDITNVNNYPSNF